MAIGANRVAKHAENSAPARATAGGLRRVRVKIRGMPPGLIFQGKGVMEADEADGKKKKKRTPAEEADLRAHWTGSGRDRQLCLMSNMVYLAICKAGGDFKFRDRKKMSSVLPSTISVEDDRIPLGTAEYEVYEEWVRIPPKTGAMVKIGRPLLKTWEATFTLIVDDEFYPVDDGNFEAIIRHAGKVVGVGAWRAELRGPYGRFTVEEFAVL